MFKIYELYDSWENTHYENWEHTHYAVLITIAFFIAIYLLCGRGCSSGCVEVEGTLQELVPSIIWFLGVDTETFYPHRPTGAFCLNLVNIY